MFVVERVGGEKRGAWVEVVEGDREARAIHTYKVADDVGLCLQVVALLDELYVVVM